MSHTQLFFNVESSSKTILYMPLRSGGGGNLDPVTNKVLLLLRSAVAGAGLGVDHDDLRRHQTGRHQPEVSATL